MVLQAGGNLPGIGMPAGMGETPTKVVCLTEVLILFLYPLTMQIDMYLSNFDAVYFVM